MVSRRFACLFLAVSMTLSSIWIVSADQSHQIQDAAEAAASYSAAVQALEEAGLSQSAQANSNIAIDLGMLEQEETVDLSQLAVQAVQLQQEEEARQAEAARQANREAARRTGRQAARQALLDAYDGAMAARQITVYAAPSDSAASLRTLRQGKVARLNDVTEDGNWYQITFSGTTGYVRADGCQTVQYSDYAGTSAVKSAREDLVDYAKSFLGTRYVWGGLPPAGLTVRLHHVRLCPLRLSHVPRGSATSCTPSPVSTAERLAGDLVFFSMAAATSPMWASIWAAGPSSTPPPTAGSRSAISMAITAAPMWVRCGSWPTDNDLLSHPPFASPRSGPTLRGELFFCRVSPNPFAVFFAFLCTIQRQKTLILAMKG